MRSVLWLTLCSLILGLASNAAGAPYTDKKEKDGENFSLADLFAKIKAEVNAVVDSIKRFTKKTETEIKKSINEYIIPLTKKSLNNTIEELKREVKKSVDGVISNIENSDEYQNLQNDLQNLTLIQPNTLQNKLIEILKKLNLKEDPNFSKELLNSILQYPETKEILESLVKKALSDIIYDEYLRLSNALRNDLKEAIRDIIKCIESYVNGKMEPKSDEIEDFAVKETENILGDAISDLIDKLFDVANKRNKEKLDDAINIDKNVIISIGDKARVF